MKETIKYDENIHPRAAGDYPLKNKQVRSTDDFVRKANWIHGIGRYDFSKVKYKSHSFKVEIVCPKHGSFFVAPSDFLKKSSGCQKCSIHKLNKSKIKTTDQFIHDLIESGKDCKNISFENAQLE